MSDRETRAGKADYMAECFTCGWMLNGRNALGVAAKHADKNRHDVFVTAERTIRFTFPEFKPQVGESER